MLFFENDYGYGAHPKVLEHLAQTNMEPVSGYGNDKFTASAAEKIKAAADCPDAQVYFLTGGTQTNMVVIDTLLRPYEGVVASSCGHVNTHEAGAIESTGHKVLTVPHKNGKLNGLTIVRLESKVDEKTGRRNMVEVSGSEKKIPAELVLIAAGFLGTEEYIAKAFGVELNQRTNVATEPGTYATNVKNVFVAGDMHRGQSLVVWAIREGREVAHDVDTSLMGYSYLSVQ